MQNIRGSPVFYQPCLLQPPQQTVPRAVLVLDSVQPGIETASFSKMIGQIAQVEQERDGLFVGFGFLLFLHESGVRCQRLSCSVLVNAHSCLRIHCEFFCTPRLLVCFYNGFASYPIFIYSIFRVWARQEEIKRIQAGRKKTKLRMAFENLVILKSHR